MHPHSGSLQHVRNACKHPPWYNDYLLVDSDDKMATEDAAIVDRALTLFLKWPDIEIFPYHHPCHDMYRPEQDDHMHYAAVHFLHGPRTCPPTDLYTLL